MGCAARSGPAVRQGSGSGLAAVIHVFAYVSDSLFSGAPLPPPSLLLHPPTADRNTGAFAYTVEGGFKCAYFRQGQILNFHRVWIYCISGYVYACVCQGVESVGVQAELLNSSTLLMLVLCLLSLYGHDPVSGVQ